MNEWQPIETCPMFEPVIVAFHGGSSREDGGIVQVATRVKQTGQWGDWDYINSHYGEPQFWMPLPEPPKGMDGPHCGCDCCTERFYDPDSPDYIPPAKL